jgi:predicted DNA-binding transcriptional regulator AlpA
MEDLMPKKNAKSYLPTPVPPSVVNCQDLQRDCSSSSPSTPLLLTASEAAAMLRVKERTWRTWDAMGRIPKPIRIGRKPFWRPEDIKAWIAVGCPDRETWEVLKR